MSLEDQLREYQQRQGYFAAEVFERFLTVVESNSPKIPLRSTNETRLEDIFTLIANLCSVNCKLSFLFQSFTHNLNENNKIY